MFRQWHNRTTAALTRRLSLTSQQQQLRCFGFATSSSTGPTRPNLDNFYQDAGATTTVTLPNGRRYVGTFEMSAAGDEPKRPLRGTTLEEDGDVYIGSYNDKWERHGWGSAWLADGTYMVGKFVNDELVDGKVTIQDSAESMVFEGRLENEMFLEGKLSHRGKVYTGRFEENRPHGPGRMSLPNGGYLEGSFYRGKMHGKGVMKLENGHIYKGEFVQGLIVSGELRTQEYVYEGQFNASGLPHGVGRSEQLAASTRLIFEGWWEEGKLLSGTCKDEHGTPIDYANRTDLQEYFSTPEQQQLNEYMASRMDDVSARRKENNDEYLHDVGVKERASEPAPSRVDLGYEYGHTNEFKPVKRYNARHAENDKAFRDSKLEKTTRECEARFASLDKERLVSLGLDEGRVHRNLRSEYGSRQVASDRLQEQYDRYRELKSRQREGKVDPGAVGKFPDRNEPAFAFYH
eukprot:PhM_4_TR3814/c0_g1_i1/m.91989